MEKFNGGAPKPSNGGGIISEHLSRILKQYELSAMNSLRGPSILSLPNNVHVNTATNNFRPPMTTQQFEQQQVSPVKKTSLTVDRSQLSGVLPMNAVNCGLIRKTDAERLTNCLIQSRASASGTNSYGFVDVNNNKKLPNGSHRKLTTIDAVFNRKNNGTLKRKSIEDVSTIIRNGNSAGVYEHSQNACSSSAASVIINECGASSMVSPCSSASTSSALSPTSSVSTRSAFSSPPAAPIDETENQVVKTRPGDSAVMTSQATNESSPSRDNDDGCTTMSVEQKNDFTSSAQKKAEKNNGKTDGSESDTEDELDVNGEDRMDEYENQTVDNDNLPVYHACFGRCKGKFRRQLYVTPSSECVECDECGIRLAPYRFVLHSHRNHEVRTCHWGFDSSNWRAYLHLASNAENSKEAEKLLDDVKTKFVNTSTMSGHKRSMSLDAQGQSLLPPEKRQRQDHDLLTAAAHQQQQGPFASVRPNVSGLTAPTGAPNLPLMMYDQLLIYQALLAAHLGATANLYGGTATSQGTGAFPLAPTAAAAASLLPLVAPHLKGQSTTLGNAGFAETAFGAMQTPMAVEEAAAALLKLAPQVAAGNLTAFDSSKLKAAAKEHHASMMMDSPNSHSCIEPLKKYILHRSMSKMGGPTVPVYSAHSQLSPNILKNGATKHGLMPTLETIKDDQGKEATSDTVDAIDALLDQYITDREGLRQIRAKLDEARRHVDNRLDSLVSQNRILQQEIFYLRNKQTNGNGVVSSQNFCGSSSILTAVSP